MPPYTEVPSETLPRVAIRFAGDSGDGMPLTGGQFTNTSALLGNDFATFPDFPEPMGVLYRDAEIESNKPVEYVLADQVSQAKQQRTADLQSLIRGRETWEVIGQANE